MKLYVLNFNKYKSKLYGTFVEPSIICNPNGRIDKVEL